jgi:hypothetical protein
MAQGVGSTKQILGQVDTFGGHFWAPIDYSGPASYVAGGDSIDPKSFGFFGSILTLIGSVDQSNAYYVEGRPLINGVDSKWQIVWLAMDGSGEVEAGTNLSGFTVRLSAIGF